mmetsp:Transcript_150659/g.484338  ORF Transcript_150659/g.484338 Transcript_150659/m.484338 type:complete len:351 (+) Transcript_150659:72-1124(+)
MQTRSWTISFCMAVFAVLVRSQRLFNAFFRVTSCPLDPMVGTLSESDLQDLVKSTADTRPFLSGRRALVLGGTRGVGRGIAVALAQGGASVVVVGRNTSSVLAVLGAAGANHGGTMEALSVDLSTVAGGLELISKLKTRAQKFDLVFFTVGSWPNYNHPATADGIEAVVALDLLSHHVVLKGLYAGGLLSRDARVMNTIASTQPFPFVTKSSVIDRLSATAPGMIPFTLFPIAVAGDAWLRATSKRMPELVFVGMFPGIVSTDLPRTSFPGWMMPVLGALMWPIAISEERSGLVHVGVLTSSNVLKRPVSFFNHLLEGREAHLLAYDEELAEGVYNWLDEALESRNVSSS